MCWQQPSVGSQQPQPCCHIPRDPGEKGTASSALGHKAEQPRGLEEQQRGQRVPEAGKGSCLQPQLSIEGREGAGLFLREEKSYGCEKRWLKIPRGPGSAGRSLGRAAIGAAAPRLAGKGGSATRVPPWPPHSHCRGGRSAPQGQNWGVPDPQTEPGAVF